MARVTSRLTWLLGGVALLSTATARCAELMRSKGAPPEGLASPPISSTAMVDPSACSGEFNQAVVSGRLLRKPFARAPYLWPIRDKTLGLLRGRFGLNFTMTSVAVGAANHFLDRFFRQHGGDSGAVRFSPQVGDPPVELRSWMVPIRESDYGGEEFNTADGTLGVDFFELGAVRLDYVAGTFELLDSEPAERLAKSSGYRTIPIERSEQGLPYVSGAINGAPRRFVIDLSGRRSALVGGDPLKGQPEAVRYLMPDGLVVPLKVANRVSVGPVSCSALTFGVVASASSGPIVRLPGSRGEWDILGTEFWERYVVLLDMAENRLSLKPNPRWKPTSIGRTGVGLSCAYQTGTLPWVSALAAPSPAASAGVVLDDEIEAVNGKQLQGLTVAQQCRLLEDLKPGRYRFRIRAKNTGRARTVELLSKKLYWSANARVRWVFEPARRRVQIPAPDLEASPGVLRELLLASTGGNGDVLVHSSHRREGPGGTLLHRFAVATGVLEWFELDVELMGATVTDRGRIIGNYWDFSWAERAMVEMVGWELPATVPDRRRRDLTVYFEAAASRKKGTPTSPKPILSRSGHDPDRSDNARPHL